MLVQTWGVSLCVISHVGVPHCQLESRLIGQITSPRSLGLCGATATQPGLLVQPTRRPGKEAGTEETPNNLVILQRAVVGRGTFRPRGLSLTKMVRL